MLKKQYVSDIQVINEFEGIPDEVILNWDHIGVNYLPGLWRRREQKGGHYRYK